MSPGLSSEKNTLLHWSGNDQIEFDPKSYEVFPHEELLNQGGSHQSNRNLSKSSRHREEMTNIINMCFGDDQKLLSEIERLRQNSYRQEASSILPNQNILKDPEKDHKFLQSMNSPSFKLRKTRKNPLLVGYPRNSLKEKRNSLMPKEWKVFYNWIIFINTSVFKELKIVKKFYNEELSDWFTEEFYHLVKLSKKELRADDEILLQKLELKGVQLTQQAPYISFLIMKVWYQDYQPDIWRTIANSNHDHIPEINMMNIVLSQALSEEIMVDQNSEGFYQSCKLDQLKIPGNHIFPLSMKPKEFLAGKKMEFLDSDPIIKGLTQKVCLVNSAKSYNGISREGVNIEGLPMSMHRHGISDTFRAKIRIPFLRDNYMFHLNRKMKFLLWYLTKCHEQFLFVQESKGIHSVPNAKTLLKKWLYYLLFGGQENHLPIFGDVDFAEGLFHKSNFLEAQIYLINEYLSPKDSQSKVVQVSLALICYWYQTFYPNIFLRSEQEYWKIMIEYLGIKTTKFGFF
jgi:hypothetical protein